MNSVPPARRHGAVMAAAALVWVVSVVLVFRGPGVPAPGGLAAGMVLIWGRSLVLLGVVATAAWGYGGLWRVTAGQPALRMTLGVATWLGVNYMVAWVGGAAGGWGFATWAVAANAVLGWVCWGAVAWRGAQGPVDHTDEWTHTAGPAPRGWGGRAWTVVLGMPGLAVLAVAACCPPGTLWRVEALGYDVTSYHLQIPREWIAAGGMVELQHSVYAYLPGLVEAGYAALAVLHAMVFAAAPAAGVVEPAVYLCQMFHVALAGLAAWNLGALVTRLTGGSREAGGLAAALVLLTPWVQVTGALAYNEMAVLAFAAAGLGVVLGGERFGGWRSGVALGLLAGAATLAKPTAGYAVALPLGCVGLARGVWGPGLARATGGRQIKAAVCGAGAAMVVSVVVGVAVLSPWMIRNAVWTGNPVFPLANAVLGAGHWDSDLTERWDRAHGPRARAHDTTVAGAVWRQALGNAGYGAVGGAATASERNNIARFGREGGVPLLWLLAAGGGGLAWWGRRRAGGKRAAVHGQASVQDTAPGVRWAVAGLGFFLVAQFVGWLGLTHLQSRFLLPVVLPLAGLSALGAGALLQRGPKAAWVARLGAVGIAGVLAAHSFAIVWSQTPRIPNAVQGRPPVALAPGWMVDALTEPGTDGYTAIGGVTPLNLLPAGSRVMVVGNNASLIYIRPSMVYASAFDRSPLSVLIADAPSPETLARGLRAKGVTHVWVGYSELDRLHATYGFDSAVTLAAVRAATAGWPVLGNPQSATVLYAVPSGPPDPAPTSPSPGDN